MDDTQKKIRELILQANPENPLQYIKSTVKDLFVNKINEAIIACDDCNCHTESIKSIGSGNPNATLLIIGESVTKQQLDSGKKIVHPFEDSKEEFLLEQMLNHYKLNKDEIFFVNALNCFPCTRINSSIIERPPGEKQLLACKVFLNSFIEAVNPVAILLLGSVTLNVFKNLRLYKARGEIIDINGYPGIATHSLSYLLSMKDIDRSCFDEFNQDLKTLLSFVNEEFPNNKLMKR